MPVYFNKNIEKDPIKLYEILQNANFILTIIFLYNLNNTDKQNFFY